MSVYVKDKTNEWMRQWLILHIHYTQLTPYSHYTTVIYGKNCNDVADISFNSVSPEFFLENDDFSKSNHIWLYDDLLIGHLNSVDRYITLNSNISGSNWNEISTIGKNIYGAEMELLCMSTLCINQCNHIDPIHSCDFIINGLKENITLS